MMRDNVMADPTPGADIGQGERRSWLDEQPSLEPHRHFPPLWKLSKGAGMQVNGVAHTFITAGDFAAAKAFYAKLLPFLGMTIVADTQNTFYGVGGRTGFGIHAPRPEFAGQRFCQGAVGLHHHCWRARERADVDEAHAFLKSIGAHIVHAPQEDGYAPGYYSVLFEDPDGTRLEINHVPGQGLLAPGQRIGGGYADGTQNG